MDDIVRVEIEYLKEKISKIEKTQEGFNSELKEQKKLLGEFDTTQQLILQKLDTITDMVQELRNSNEELRATPAKKWESAKWIVVSVIITTIVTAIITKLVG